MSWLPEVFLSARWENLALLNYSVEPSRFEPYLPPGTELELMDGKAWLSLVAFDFCDTRALGIRWWGYTDFPEINLRFYVRRGEDRGVVFVREYVPLRAIAWLAWGLYNEPYVRAPMRSEVDLDGKTRRIRHELEVGGRTHRLEVRAKDAPFVPEEGSLEHHFKEHSWGFGQTRSGRPLAYQVEHPLWQVDPVLSLDLDWDFGLVYGPEFQVLNDRAPDSVFLARGSEITVAPYRGLG